MDEQRKHAQAALTELRGAFDAHGRLRRAEWGAWAWGLLLLGIVAAIVIFADEINPRKGLKAVLGAIAALIGAFVSFGRAATARRHRKAVEAQLAALQLTPEGVQELTRMADSADSRGDQQGGGST